MILADESQTTIAMLSGTQSLVEVLAWEAGLCEVERW